MTDQLRAQGVRVTLVKPAEIAAKANEYLSARLYDEARERARRMGMFERKAQRRTRR